MRIYPFLLLFLLSAASPHEATAQNRQLFFASKHLVSHLPNTIYTAECPDSVRIVQAFYAKGVNPDTYDLIPGDTLPVTRIRRGVYFIRPQRVECIGVLFVTEQAGRLDTVSKGVRPVVPVIRLGGNDWKKDSMALNMAKAQRGIYAQIENYDIDARCAIKGFSVTRVRSDGHRTIYNQGGNFSPTAKTMIDRLEAGDLLLFRQITYRCPGNASPYGARDLIFTIY